jgi:hypothetical protein
MFWMVNLKEINISDTGQSSTESHMAHGAKGITNIINVLDVLMRTLKEDLVNPGESS